MPAADPGPEWVLLDAQSPSAPRSDSELVNAARSAWPKALAHVRNEQRHGRYADGGSLATEVWEGVLLSVSKTFARMNGRRRDVGDLEAYLLGTFYHRFSRALRKERRREETIHLVASARELEVLSTAGRAVQERAFEGDIHAQEIVERMDDWSRKVWVAREYGYSWKDIGKTLGVSGDKVMFRFRRRMKILRERLSGRG